MYSVDLVLAVVHWTSSGSIGTSDNGDGDVSARGRELYD